MEQSVMDRITRRLHLRRGECWQIGRQRGPGYAGIKIDGKNHLAHVFMYEYFVGPVPRGQELDHVVCGHKWCCNPYHVEPVTHKRNCVRASVRPEGYFKRTK